MRVRYGHCVLQVIGPDEGWHDAEANKPLGQMGEAAAIALCDRINADGGMARVLIRFPGYDDVLEEEDVIHESSYTEAG